MSRDHTGRRTSDDRRDILSALIYLMLVRWFRLAGCVHLRDERQTERRNGWCRRARIAAHSSYHPRNN